MATPELIQIFIFLFVFAGVGFLFFYDHKLKVPPMPTMPWVRRRIIKALKSHTKKEDLKIVELGSGWGGLAFSLARAFPRAQIDGYEKSPFPYWYSRLWALFYKNVHITYTDFYDENLENYDVLVFYLSPQHNKALSKKFKNNLKPGALLVTSAFELPGHEPIEVLEKNLLVKFRVYVYRAGKETQ